MNHFLPFLLCLTGFVTLALAMDRPQETVFGYALPRARVTALRIVGAGLLWLALAWLTSRQGLGLGLVMFSGHTSLAAGLVFCALVCLERWRAARKPAER